MKKYIRIVRVHRDLILCGITDETLCVGEGDIRRCRSVTLVVGDDLNTIILPDTDTTSRKSVSTKKFFRNRKERTYE